MHLNKALSSVRRHSAAGQVVLAVKRDGGDCHLQVGDDGVGLRASHPWSGHVGLRTMAEHANALGGWIKIEDAASGGTIVRFLSAHQSLGCGCRGCRARFCEVLAQEDAGHWIP